MAENMDSVLVSLVEAKLKDGQINADEVRVLLTEISDEEMRLRELKRQVENACSHKNAKGVKTTQSTGGGFAQCWVCHGEID
jgi:hypothetical protein